MSSSLAGTPHLSGFECVRTYPVAPQFLRRVTQGAPASLFLGAGFRESMFSATEAVCRLIGGLLYGMSAAHAILVNKRSMPHLVFMHLARMGVVFRDHERLFQPVMDCHMLTAHRTPSEIRMRSLQEKIPTRRTVRTYPFTDHRHHLPFTVLQHSC